MTPEERIEQLESKIQQAHQVIGTLLAGPDGDLVDFDLPGGRRALDYFAHEDYQDDFLPFVHPRLVKS